MHSYLIGNHIDKRKDRKKRANKMTPRVAFKKFCFECVGYDKKELKDCGGGALCSGSEYIVCPLYPILRKKTRYVVKAIRKHCLYCTNGQEKAVRECPSRHCFLWPFRMGKNPNIIRKKKLVAGECQNEGQKMVSEKAISIQITTQRDEDMC